MSRTYGNEKKPSQSTTSVKPTASFLQTRDFAPLQTDLDEDAPFQPSGYTENFLEKIINQRSTESSDTPVQAKPQNRLKILQAKPMAIQAKLNIGEPNDKYEKEADNTAAKVVQQINSPIQEQSVQRQESMEEEDEELQMKSEISTLQRQESMEEEDEELQIKSLVQRSENIGGGEASTDLELSIQSARGSGQSLDSNLQAKMGQAMGADFSGVKVHTDSQSDQLNQSIQAKAFTTGQDVFFRQGAYKPSSRGGQELIAHELTHVVQQNGSAVQRSSESVIQRDWDSVAYETEDPTQYAVLLAKMEGLIPAMGKSRLSKLAALTDSPEQLKTLLKMGTSNLQIYLNSIDAPTLVKLMDLSSGLQPFIKLVNDLIKFKVPIKTYLDENPAATLLNVEAQIASAKSAAGLISANGNEIALTSVAAVVGDGKKDEKTAVAAAVSALDGGTLVGSPHGNGEGNLPGVRGAGGYTEYDVTPPTGTSGRGERRLVVHNAKKFIYYTWNHYGKDGTVLPAFKRIK